MHNNSCNQKNKNKFETNQKSERKIYYGFPFVAIFNH